jgi:hypothetical protein
MVSADTRSVIDRAKRIYDERLRVTLEAEHHGRFVAIEPESGDHFVADTLSGAAEKALERHPTRLTHIIRVGHRAAIHIGEMTC